MTNEVKKRIDLHGVSCPINFVKTKLALEELEEGELLEVILDEGNAMLNVPRSVKEEGHTVIRVEPLGETFRVIIRKG
ncbi:sulfurtransferase TusA family protein [Methanosphaerula subterraneus]|uniref:sulfurtransferase TusA family protein n=1 Tax=Methanosphaerula subterraneus TaxID=3350244 RepID=UPI003F875FDB